VQIRVLGPVEVLGDDGMEHQLASPRQRLLLAGLAAHAGDVVTADALIELLWGDCLPSHPLAALQSQVSRLRRRLGASVPIVMAAGGYRLDAAEIVDAVRFRQLLDHVRRGGGDTLAALEEALGLWRRAPMGGLDAPGLDVIAARLEEEYADAAERWVLALLGLGRYGEAAACAGKLAAEAPFRERPVALQMEALARGGRHAEALRVYAAFGRSLAEELGLDPSTELADLQQRILQASAGPASAALPSAPGTSLVGRENDLAAAVSHLRCGRLVTLTGPGGVGKTRLALHLAHCLGGKYSGGTWFCDLSALKAGSGIEAAVAGTLGVDPRAGEQLTSRIVAFLRTRQALLVLDNCEHVLAHAAALVARLLEGAPTTTILATSRERLRVPGEQRMPVEPLPVTTTAGLTGAAVELFFQRARLASPAFELAPVVAAQVAELCAALGGLPLAIEIAAARTATRSAGDILSELRRHEGELRGERERSGRHQSLHAVVAWSCDLLTPARREVFENMAVFAGGWDLAAASAVAGPRLSRDQVADAMDDLAEPSLVTVDTTGSETRWALLEPVRAFAGSRLRSRGSAAEIWDRHAEFFVSLVEASSTGLAGSDERSWADRLAAELANLRAAHRWLLDTGKATLSLRLAAGCYRWAFAGAPAEVSAWAAETAARFGDAPDLNLAGALATAAVGAWRQGDHERAIRLASRGVTLGAGHPGPTRWALDALGDASIIAGRYQQAIDAYEAGIRLSQAADDVPTLANGTGSVALALAYQGDAAEATRRADALLEKAASVANPSTIGWAHYFAGEVRLDSRPDEALPMLRRALAEAERAGNRFLAGVTLASLVSLEARTDDSPAALHRYGQLITYWQQTGAWTQLWIAIRSLIEALEQRGHPEPAAVLYGALAASPNASPLAGADATRLARVAADLTTRLGPAAFDALRARGKAMGDDSALSYAIDVLGRASTDAADA
jgi:predicted ATPase/DNA-binding SARP family transcriptional activator